MREQPRSTERPSERSERLDRLVRCATECGITERGPADTFLPCARIIPFPANVRPMPIRPILRQSAMLATECANRHWISPIAQSQPPSGPLAFRNLCTGVMPPVARQTKNTAWPEPLRQPTVDPPHLPPSSKPAYFTRGRRNQH